MLESGNTFCFMAWSCTSAQSTSRAHLAQDRYLFGKVSFATQENYVAIYRSALASDPIIITKQVLEKELVAGGRP